jgi:hypothetical protein
MERTVIETTIEQVQRNSLENEWEEFLKPDREEKLKTHANSIVLEASFLEIDTADAWLCKRHGAKTTAWDSYFYYKESYDYGYVEYFFIETAHLNAFKNEVPNFYALWPDGTRAKTNGWNVFIELE